METLLLLLESPLFHTSLIIGITPSIPRWEFLRVLQAKDENKPNSKRGVSSIGFALRGLQIKTMERLKGQNSLTEKVITACLTLAFLSTQRAMRILDVV